MPSPFWLRVPILRWPGGNFMSGYHWTDGVGPRDKRPPRVELAWHAEEPNRLRTDEFIDPTIELVSCGQWGWTDWDRIVIDALAPYVRYHSIHLYTGSSNYWRNVLMVHQTEHLVSHAQ
jgi:hypothetical protein